MVEIVNEARPSLLFDALEISMPTIRLAEPSDAASLAELAERTFRQAFGGANTIEDINLHCGTNFGESLQAAEIANAEMITLVCEERGNLIAFAQLRWGKAPACVSAYHPGEIYRFYVENQWHGKGIAQALMSACFAQMEEHKSEVVWLGVWERNPRAISFYKKFGFMVVGEQVFQLGLDRQRDLVMARSVGTTTTST